MQTTTTLTAPLRRHCPVTATLHVRAIYWLQAATPWTCAVWQQTMEQEFETGQPQLLSTMAAPHVVTLSGDWQSDWWSQDVVSNRPSLKFMYLRGVCFEGMRQTADCVKPPYLSRFDPRTSRQPVTFRPRDPLSLPSLSHRPVARRAVHPAVRYCALTHGLQPADVLTR